MAYTRVKLIDPSGALGVYTWDVGYNEEGEFGQRRNLEAIANTAGTGYVVQQGQDEPQAISVSGKFTTKAQHQQFIRFFKRGKLQSMIFEDFEGAQYEVLITAYLPKRMRASRNPRGGASAMYHYYSYTLEMMVLRVITGDWTLV